jgi:hypothetical protein
MTQIDVDRMFGRLTESMAAQAVCPDWAGHRRLYAQSELTWRLTPEQKRADWADGCGHCGGHLPLQVVAAALLDSDSLPDVGAGVEGHQIGGRHR